jgi:hypothetical protein
MKITPRRACAHWLGAAANAVCLALLCGCGSGINLPGSGGAGSPAATAAPNGPQLGYFWNASDQSLRPILGIPGASQIGQSVVPAGAYVTGSASSAANVAVLQEPDGTLDVMTLPAGQPMHVKTATTGGAQIRFSPSGKSALVFTPGTSSVSLLTALTSAPSVTTIASPSAIQDAALADSGSIAIASGTNIQLLSAAGTTTTLGTVGTLGGLAFATADDLLFADSSANTLTLVRSASTKPSPSLVQTASLLMSPSALGVSPNGQWVLIANSAEASTVRIDLSAQTVPLRIACACTPALAVPVSGTATFRITAATAGPIWAVDAGVATPRSFFIPAVHP